MQTWLLSLLSIGLGGSAAAVAALALRPWLMCRYTARWRCRLWGVLAAVLLAGPVLLALPLPQRPAAPGWRVTLPAPETAPTDRVSAAQSGEFSTKENDPVENPAHPETDTSAVTGNQPTAETVPQAGNATPKAEFPVKLPQLPKPSLPAAVFALWLAGALGFALWRAAGYWLWSRRVRRWDSPAPEWAAELARAAAAEQGLRRSVPVRCNARISGPLVTGLARPTLLLPETLPPEEELAMICLHEMAHCRRGDLWYMLLLEAARAMHWYSPPVHFLVRAARQDIEMACDESAAANKPAAWRRQYCEALLHALECPAGPVLTTRFGVGKSQITARLRQIMKPGRMRRGLLAFCAGALAVTLCCCAVRLEPASTSRTNTEEEAPVWVDITQPEGGQLDLAYLTGQKNGLPEPARPGTEMTDEEIYALAEDLIKRGEAWEAWAGDTARYALIEADHVTWTWEGEAGVGYRLLDVTDAVQLRAVLESLFSRAYVEEKWQHLVTQEENYLYTGTLLERDGKLYANEKRAFDSSSAYQYDPASIQIMGVTEESISLQVKLRFTVDSTADRSYPLTLRRERGRWVLDGWENDGRSDNSYIRLPEELDARVAADPELGTRLRYVWALGEGLRDGDQTRVDWAFSGVLEPPSHYDWMGPDAYSLSDITRLQVADFKVEVTEEDAIYLWLDVTDPDNTPLRPGAVWYRVVSAQWLGTSLEGTVDKLYPESETEAFRGVARGTEDDATAQELLETANFYHAVTHGGSFSNDQNMLSDTGVIVYLAGRMSQETGETNFTRERLGQAALEYLDWSDYLPAPEALAQVCTEENGVYGTMPMGFIDEVDTNCRWLGAELATGTGYAVRRYYKDGLGLVPDYDLVYTLHRSQGGTGSWVVDGCQKMDGGWEGVY